MNTICQQCVILNISTESGLSARTAFRIVCSPNAMPQPQVLCLPDPSPTYSWKGQVGAPELQLASEKQGHASTSLSKKPMSMCSMHQQTWMCPNPFLQTFLSGVLTYFLNFLANQCRALIMNHFCLLLKAACLCEQSFFRVRDSVTVAALIDNLLPRVLANRNDAAWNQLKQLLNVV